MPKTSNKPRTKSLLKTSKLEYRDFPEMRRISQITSSHCGPAVLAMMLSFYGKRLDQRVIVKSIKAGRKIHKHGVTISELAAALLYLRPNYVMWSKKSANISDIVELMNVHNVPVAVEWQGIFPKIADGDDVGHYCVAVAIDQEFRTITMADPYPDYHPQDRIIALAEFEKRWWDTNVIITSEGKEKEVPEKRVIFFVTEKGATFPRKLACEKVI